MKSFLFIFCILLASQQTWAMNATDPLSPNYFPDREAFTTQVEADLRRERQNSKKPIDLSILSEIELLFKSFADSPAFDHDGTLKHSFAQMLCNSCIDEVSEFIRLQAIDPETPPLPVSIKRAAQTIRTYFFQAAEEGNFEASQKLAKFLESGIGGPRRLELSILLKRFGPEILQNTQAIAFYVQVRFPSPRSTLNTDVNRWLDEADEDQDG